jgi:hypothetical protein
VGNHWEWLIAVAAIVFWIVQSLRGGEEERNRNRQRAGGEAGPANKPARRPATDIDRFLDEVNRRRRQAAERKPVVVLREKPPAPAPASRPRPSVRLPAPRPIPQPAPLRPVLERPAKPAPVTVPGAVAEIVFATPVVATPVDVAAEPRPVQPAPSPGPVVPGPAASRIEALLTSPEDLQAILVLREIFGPPLCRRGRP